MTLSLSNNTYTFTTEQYGKYVIIPLDLNTYCGDKLTFYNGGIRIGKGVSKILVSGQMLIYSKQNILYLRVVKNDVGNNFEKNTILYTSNSQLDDGILEYRTLNSSNILYDNIKEGDIIYLSTYAMEDMVISNRALDMGACTYLTVQAI